MGTFDDFAGGLRSGSLSLAGVHGPLVFACDSPPCRQQGRASELLQVLAHNVEVLALVLFAAFALALLVPLFKNA